MTLARIHRLDWSTKQFTLPGFNLNKNKRLLLAHHQVNLVTESNPEPPTENLQTLLF
jgi:hypothetical protein